MNVSVFGFKILICVLAMDNSLTDILNDKQKEAVTYTDGPCMVIAGPGSGKTKILTTKIAYLMSHDKIPSGNIIALTFTNKAANEMRSRVGKMIDNDLDNLLIGTFHSCFANILRRESKSIGYDSNFSILDSTDSKALVTQILNDLLLDVKIYNVNSMVHRISLMKNMLITPDLYAHNDEYILEDQFKRVPRFIDVYKEYVRRCKISNSMDFDDLLVNMYLLLRDNDVIRNKYQEKFKYILVDEFQDTNVVQYEIVKVLAVKYRNLCVVGDDAQSIYSFRGATVDNMLNFKNDYPDVNVIRLEQNYRSTQNIVNIANAVISKNKKQLKKKLWTSNNVGDKCSAFEFKNDIEEASTIAQTINRDVESGKIKYSDVAVLYRTNNQSRVFENEFNVFKVPYKLFGGMSFYQHKEIKDLLAYMMVVINPNNFEAIKRTINEPRRGIGKSILKKVQDLIDKNNVPVWTILEQSHLYFSPKISELLGRYVDIIRESINSLDKKNAYDIANDLCSSSGLLEMYKNNNSDDTNDKYKNILELLNSIKSFVIDEKNEDKSLKAFLEDLPLKQDIDDDNNVKGSDFVSLMTIHSAKGLEFKNVYIVGCEDGLIPLDSKTSGSLEEERRLLYVAITRAKEQVCISYSLQRNMFGKVQIMHRSCFLDDISQSLLLKPRNIKDLKTDGNFSLFQTTVFKKKLNSVRNKAIRKYYKNNIEEKVQHVFHPKFGRGLLIDNFSNNTAKVVFEKYGEKIMDYSCFYSETD